MYAVQTQHSHHRHTAQQAGDSRITDIQPASIGPKGRLNQPLIIVDKTPPPHDSTASLYPSARMQVT